MTEVPPDVSQELRVPWDDDAADLYEHAPCGYLSTLPDGTIVRVNQTLLTWTGYERGALVGKRRFRDLLTPGGRIYHETHFAPLLGMQDEVHAVAFDVVRADGRRLPTLVNAVLSRDDDGAPRVVRTSVFDATERRSYERELLAARRAAEESEERVRLLQRVVAELAAASTEAEMAHAVVRAPRAAFGADGAQMWLTDADGGWYPAAAEPAGAGPLDGLDPLVAEVAAGGEPFLAGSVAQARRRSAALGEALDAAGWQAVALLPLVSVSVDPPGDPDGGPAVLGVLAFAFTAPRTLDDAEQRVVRLLGHQAGQALERARLSEAARRAQERTVFLAETGRELEEEPRLMPRAHRLVQRLVPAVARWAAVRLQIGPAGLLAEAGGPAPDPAWLADRVVEVSVSGVGRTADAGPEAGCAVLPLTANGQVLGTLAVRRGDGPPVPATFWDALAGRAGLALENARLYEQERAIARTLQRSLLATDLPLDPRFAVETHYQAGAHELEVGGDWYDAFLISGDKLAVVVGDVVGRGIDAATTMGQLRSAIRALASADAGPARLLERLDVFTERVDSARMATVAYAELALTTGELTYACAGHVPPLLLEPAAAPLYLVDARSAPLGSRAGHTAREQRRIRLAPGSRLMFYTDGLIERRGRLIDTGFALLAREYAERRDAPLPGLASALADTLVGREHEHADDVCVLIVALGTDRRFERTVGADPTQIAPLRQDLRGWLAAQGLADADVQAVLLAASEAVANAIEHGYRNDPFGTVRITADVTASGIEVTVADRGTWRPAPSDALRGRGLRLMREAMDDVEVDTGGGTVVTLRRSLAREAT